MLPYTQVYESVPSHLDLEEKAGPEGSDTERLILPSHGVETPRVRRQWAPVVYTALGGVIALVLILSLSVFHGNGLTLETRSPIPALPTQIIVLSPDHRYEQPASPESDTLWDSNLPGGKGFLLLNDPDAYGLPPGLPSPNGTAVYGVTWTHEYHCLVSTTPPASPRGVVNSPVLIVPQKLIRTEFWKALYGTSKLYGGQHADPPLGELDARRLSHTQHCFDYVRQLIMCRADMTIEWAASEPDPLGNKHHINGYGVPHTCTKWDAMYEYMMDAQPPRHAHHKA